MVLPSRNGSVVKSALVTGASGFIGSHLVARLVQADHAVRVVLHERFNTTDWPKNVEVVRGDVCDANAMKAAAVGVDTVFHLAGKTHALSEIEGNEAGYRSLNVEGTRHVLDAAVAGGARRFVFFSSVKAIGEESSECRDESWAAAPLTAYGRSKLAAEALVFEYGQRGQLGVTCLRLPLVYGRGNRGNLFRMMVAIDRGVFPSFPPLENRRSMVHVSNVVAAAMLAADHPAACGRCYIVTDARAYSTRELYEAIRRGLGKGVPRWSVPVGVLAMLGRMGDCLGRLRGRRIGFDSEALAKLTGSAWYSATRISRELGYRPLVSFETALPDMIAWYRETLA
jgi:nucleoside-diphosphate-sugar epimerase